MSISGSISVNALFHDTDGTTSLKIVSLKSSDEYTTGKVAIVTGTVGTSSVSISCLPTTYRSASGALVSFSSVSRIVFQASSACTIDDGANSLVDQTLCAFKGVSQPDISVVTSAHTASYTIVLYGT